jgi:glycerol uptake facilitator-like aquaporin
MRDHRDGPINPPGTGAILVVLILIFGPLSGAHFNPAVSIAFALRAELPWQIAAAYIAAQIFGAIVGVWTAHLMFELPLWQLSITVRTGLGQWLAEAVATFGLLLTILGCVARTPAAVPYAVGLYITAAYWFTASTSFANPAVTIARSLSDTFAGIAPSGAVQFIAAQLAGMLLAVSLGAVALARSMTGVIRYRSAALDMSRSARSGSAPKGGNGVMGFTGLSCSGVEGSGAARLSRFDSDV